MTPEPIIILDIASSASAPPFFIAVLIEGNANPNKEFRKEYSARLRGVLTKGK